MLKNKAGAIMLAAVMAVCTMTTTAIAAQPPNELPKSAGQGSVVPYWLNLSSAYTNLSATGSTLKLSTTIKAKSSSDDIDGILYLEMKSWGAWTELDSWSISGTGSLSSAKSYTDAKPGTYRSRVVVTVDSEEIEIVSASKTIK